MQTSLRRLVISCGVLGTISLLATGLSRLALQDIFHAREPDLSLEWQIVRVAHMLWGVFYTAVCYTLWQTLRER